MKWDDTYEGAHKQYTWHDLLDDDEKLLGYVRCTMATNEFIACINDMRSDMRSDTKKFNNLEDAKAHIVAYYVTQKLEGE